MYDYTLNLLHHLTLVQDPVVTDGPIHKLLIEAPNLIDDRGLIEDQLLLAEPRTGYALPDADAYARRLAEEAEAWLEYARERSRMKDGTLVSKALQSLAFTLRHRAHDFAVPSKLTGTSKHQSVLWSMVKDHVGLGTPLDVEEIATDKRPRLVVSYEGDELGEVQSKHTPWLRALLPFGAGIHLVRVTGTDSDYTLGCNVAFGRVGSAVAALGHALGTDVGGDGYGGDGAPRASVGAAGIEALPGPDRGGDGARTADGEGVRGPLRLVPSGPSVAKPQDDTLTATSPDDIVLSREIDGTARATVKHVPRHSHAVEWHSLGAGASDLAYSVLVALSDEETAQRWHVAFKEDVIASVPQAGGVIRAAAVRAWLAAQRSTQR